MTYGLESTYALEEHKHGMLRPDIDTTLPHARSEGLHHPGVAAGVNGTMNFSCISRKGGTTNTLPRITETREILHEHAEPSRENSSG